MQANMTAPDCETASGRRNWDESFSSFSITISRNGEAHRRYAAAKALSASSGITSKPAIEDHFKTGQRTITLDELVLPYRLAVWQVQFDPVRSLIVSPEMPAVIPARRSAGPYSSPPLPASGGEL